MTTMTTKYEYFSKEDESTNLGKFINTVFSKLSCLRILSVPKTFPHENEYIGYKEMNAVLFYDLCLTETYLHSIYMKLHQWKEKAIEYNIEFQSSWKYYAAAKRLKFIRDDGCGGENDYNADGTIKTEVDETTLADYSIIGELVNEDCRDIFLQTDPKDLLQTVKYLIADSNISIPDIFKHATGREITTYRMENGEMKENNWADNQILNCENKEHARMVADYLIGLAVEIKTLVELTRQKEKTSDNKEFFIAMPALVQKILDMQIEPYDTTKIITIKNE
jgi:hypothetical protein